MKRIVISLLLATTACATGVDGHDESAAVPAPQRATESSVEHAPSALAGSGRQLEGTGQRLAQLEIGSHSIELYETAPGALAVVEDSPFDAPSLLADVPLEASATDIYEQFAAAPAPPAIVDFQARARASADLKRLHPMQSAQLDTRAEPHGLLATSAPDVRVLAGPPPVSDLGADPLATVFERDYCDYIPSYNLGTDPVRVRRFCYPEGRVGSKTESATANILIHHVAALLFGDVTYTATTRLADGSPSTTSWTVAPNRLKRFRLANEYVWYDVPCPSGAVCSGVMLPRVGVITGKVSDPDNTYWRFGGSFWKPNPDIYTPQ